MFGLFGYDGGGYGFFGDFDDGPDRSHWRDKSDAAIRRETQAKNLMIQYLERCKAMEESAFPVSEEIIPPQVHLTDPCWKTFKQFVTSKGCTTKRRIATHQERIDSKDKRKSKLYVISVTVPVHPTKVEEAKRVKEQRAKEAEEKRRIEMERKAKAAKELQDRIENEYKAIVKSLKKEDVDDDTKVPVGTVLKGLDTNQEEMTPSPPKKLKMTAAVTITVPKPRLVAHAETIHRQRQSEIISAIHKEQRKEEQQALDLVREKMQAKKKKLQDDANAQLETIKGAIAAA